jgi:transcriptional regulator with XRE-family HTH domain
MLVPMNERSWRGGTSPVVEEEFKVYLRRHIRTSGVNSQSELARRTGIDVSYINKIAMGRIMRPEIETLEKIAPVIRRPIEEVMRAAGYPVPPPSGEEVARRLVIQALGSDEEYDSDAIVAYVESRPGKVFQEQMAEARRSRPYPDYVEFCVSIFRAWESNSDLGLKAYRFGRGPGTSGL